jgi:hypothetical protein
MRGPNVQIGISDFKGEVELDGSTVTWLIAVGLGALVFLPFYLFFVFKLAGAGWAAGQFLYLKYTRGRYQNGNVS